MEETNKTVEQAPGGLPSIIPRIGFDLRLRSLKSSRQTLARVLREYGRGTIDDATYRGLVWGLNNFLGYLRESGAEELEVRLKTLEAKLDEIEKGGRGANIRSA